MAKKKPTPQKPERSMKPPLQSMQRELDTSQQQLQLLNQQLHGKVAELERIKAELDQRVRQRTDELKAAGDQLRRERDRARRYLDVVGVMMVALDVDGKVTLVNPKACEVLGLEEADILGKDWFQHFLPERLRGEVRGVFDRIMKGEVASVEHFENPIRRPDGQERLILWHNSELKDDDGQIVGALASGTDITQTRRDRDSLRESEARLSAIVDTAVDAIITINSRGIIDSVNPAAERMFGYTPAELIGQNVNILMPPPYRDEHDAYIARYLETGQPRIIGIGREVEGRRKDGSLFPVDLAVSEFHDQAGPMFTGVIRDITQRRAEQDRLLQSERLAALGEAMAGLTHESRNALARSHSNLRRLARRLKDRPELLQLIDAALAAEDDIRRQFDEVREYAAPLNLQREPTDLGKLIQQAWKHLAADRKGRQAELRLPETDRDLTCDVDQFSIRNAFRNILENSLSACEDPVEIDITITEAHINGSPALQISIRDNGPGLPPEAAERLFDAFFTTKTRGTGLGLAIVKRTVEAHGGEVGVGKHRAGLYESGPGSQNAAPSGTEIIITLPRKQP